MKRFRQRPARALRFETLEPRRVLTNGIVASLAANGVLNVIGTGGDDQCLFHETSGTISIAGVSGAWQASKIKSIHIDLAGGNDFISLNSAANGGNQAIRKALEFVSGS